MKENTYYQFKDAAAIVGFLNSEDSNKDIVLKIIELSPFKVLQWGSSAVYDVVDEDGNPAVALDEDDEEVEVSIGSDEYRFFVEYTGEKPKSSVEVFDSAVEKVKSVVNTTPTIDAVLKLVRFEMK